MINKIFKKIFRQREKIGTDVAVKSYSTKESITKSLPDALINVGIDFGTSTTKIIYRDLINTHRDPFLILLNENYSNLPTFLIPSSISIKDKRVYFGDEAENKINARIIRSFKICMACQLNVATCRDCEPLKASKRLTNGWFHVDGYENKISAVFLCVIYIAYIISKVNDIVKKHYNKHNVNLTYNISAPLEQIDISEIEKKYNYYYVLSEQIAKFTYQGAFIDDLITHYDNAKNKIDKLPDKATRKVFVQPETVAAVLPYARDRTTDEGLYSIVDVGAGTTDVSFFRLGPHMPRKLAFYDATTESVGGDDVDHDIFNYLVQKGKLSLTDAGNQNNIINKIRYCKNELMNSNKLELSYDDSLQVIDDINITDLDIPTFNRIYQVYERAWMGSFKKEEIIRKWEYYRIIFLGGGARIPQIRHKIKHPLRDFIKNVEEVNALRIDGNIQYDKSIESEVKQNIDLLGVAYGLSMPPVEFMKIRTPSDVLPIQKTERIIEGPDPDEPFYPGET